MPKAVQQTEQIRSHVSQPLVEDGVGGGGGVIRKLSNILIGSSATLIFFLYL